MSTSEDHHNDDAPNYAWLLKRAVIRIAGATVTLTIVVALALGALDTLSQHALSRKVASADVNQPLSRWSPFRLAAVGGTEVALVSPAEAAPHPALDQVVTAEPVVTPVVLPQPEPAPAPIPAPVPIQPIASAPASLPAPPQGPAGMKLAALSPAQDASLPPQNAPAAASHDVIAVVSIPLPTPAPERPPLPPTPAQRLGLDAKQRAKAEKCLAEAVYFEARSEQLRGQIAVAQVVMNRVFSPFYPNDVCDVVYQNAHRRLACQFTFACDGQPERVTEWSAWRRAKRIARHTLDGKIWVAEVAKSTHYHAAYVRPHWVREMKKMARYGLHTFYRPHRWGDGSQEITWSNIVHIAARAAIVE